MDKDLQEFQALNPVKGKAFTLRGRFEPAGDQPEAIRQLIEGLN
ncbi:MAG: hypothetical protein RL661_383, partial [Pseudomonadota bacterium]